MVSQLGEGLDLDFVSGAIGGGTYYEDHITSDYTEGVITVYVRIKPSYLDPHNWQQRARTRFEVKLPSTIERERDRYEVADYLRKLYAASPTVPTPSRDAPRRHFSYGRRWLN